MPVTLQVPNEYGYVLMNFPAPPDSFNSLPVPLFSFFYNLGPT